MRLATINEKRVSKHILGWFFFQKLVALHFTSVSQSVSHSVRVLDQRSLELVLGSVVTFGGKVITFGGPLSFQIYLCTLCQVRQNLGRGQTPSPFFWKCQDFDSDYHCISSLSGSCDLGCLLSTPDICHFLCATAFFGLQIVRPKSGQIYDKNCIAIKQRKLILGVLAVLVCCTCCFSWRTWCFLHWNGVFVT